MSSSRSSTHQACVRCGAPVTLDVALCETCNPLGLAQPSASQAHGTVFLGIGAAVLILAALAGASSKGVGPFTGSLSSAVSAPGGLAVTLTVMNAGTGPGSATCSVTTTKLGSAGIIEILNTPRIDAGATISVDRVVRNFGTTPLPLVVQCGG